MDDKSQRMGEPNSKEITLRIYHHSDEYKDYLSARFYPSTGRSRLSFEWEGHRWAYRHTHFDDQGDYDLIYRPAPQPAEPADSNNFIQLVPEHCDRILWKGSYYHLPIQPDEPVKVPSDAQLKEFWRQLTEAGGDEVDFARALLARYGHNLTMLTKRVTI